MDKKYSKNELFYGICRYFPPPFDAQREDTTHSSPFRWSRLIEKEASPVRCHSFTPSWTHGGCFLNKHSSSPSSFYPVSGCSVPNHFFPLMKKRREEKEEVNLDRTNWGLWKRLIHITRSSVVSKWLYFFHYFLLSSQFRAFFVDVCMHVCLLLMKWKCFVGKGLAWTQPGVMRKEPQIASRKTHFPWHLFPPPHIISYRLRLPLFLSPLFSSVRPLQKKCSFIVGTLVLSPLFCVETHLSLSRKGLHSNF